MKHVNKVHSFFTLLFLAGVCGLLFSRCGRSIDEKLKIRSEYLERHEYQQRELNKIMLDIRPINNKLHLLMVDTSAQFSSDSAKALLRRSFGVLMNCERLVYELQEFNSHDSLMFEMYGR